MELPVVVPVVFWNQTVNDLVDFLSKHQLTHRRRLRTDYALGPRVRAIRPIVIIKLCLQPMQLRPQLRNIAFAVQVLLLDRW